MRTTILIILLLLFTGGTSALAQDAPSGTIAFKPKIANFRNVMEDSCRPKKIIATNNTGAPIENPEFRVSDPDAFAIQRGFRKCPNPLGPGQKCSIYVDFCPQFLRTYRAKLYFQGNLNFVEMLGEGVAPAF
jgi:hypothetical protein